MNKEFKRVYKLTSTQSDANGYAVTLDGKPINTPLKRLLVAPTKDLAQAVAKEWADQGEMVIPDQMPLTSLLTTAIDRAGERKDLTAKMVSYLDTDLLCYRSTEPKALAEKEKDLWDPWISWFEDHFGVKLKKTDGIQPIKQDMEAHKRVRSYIEALELYDFTILQTMTHTCGSVILALAFFEGEIEDEEIFNAVYLEEMHHAELCGENDPVIEKKQEQFKADVIAANYFMSLL